MIELALFCRNEAPRIRSAIEALRSHADEIPARLLPLHVAVLENGSTDGTAEAATRAARELTEPDRFVVRVRSGLPAGKTAAWNVFVESATAELLLFMDSDVVAAPGALRTLLTELDGDPGLDLVSAVPSVPAGFQPTGFWQSVFAVPYHGLRPAPSVTGTLYGARRDRLRPLDPDILHEDLALALRHEGAFAVCREARVHVTPPKTFGEFIHQRVRCLRADLAAERRSGKDVAPHRRRSFGDVLDFLRAGGPIRLAAFLFARVVATTIARRQGPGHGGGWLPRAGR